MTVFLLQNIILHSISFAWRPKTYQFRSLTKTHKHIQLNKLPRKINFSQLSRHCEQIFDAPSLRWYSWNFRFRLVIFQFVHFLFIIWTFFVLMRHVCIKVNRVKESLGCRCQFITKENSPVRGHDFLTQIKAYSFKRCAPVGDVCLRFYLVVDFSSSWKKRSPIHQHLLYHVILFAEIWASEMICWRNKNVRKEYSYIILLLMPFAY